MGNSLSGTSEESLGRPSLIEWMTFGKVGDSATGTAFRKVQKVPEAMQIDEADASTTYVGWAEPASATSGAVWKVQKIAVSGTATSITWADGNTLYDNIWDNRASLSYS